MKLFKRIISSCMAVACCSAAMCSLPASATTMVGDVNGSGYVDLSDLVVLAKYLKGNADLQDSSMARADCNVDYIIDIVDYNILSDFIVNNISTLPYTG